MSNTYSKENRRKTTCNFIILGLTDNYIGGGIICICFQLNNVGLKQFIYILTMNHRFDKLSI